MDELGLLRDERFFLEPFGGTHESHSPSAPFQLRDGVADHVAAASAGVTVTFVDESWASF